MKNPIFWCLEKKLEDLNHIYIYIYTLTKRIGKKLDGNHTRLLHVILNESLKQHPTKKQLYGHSPPILQTIQVRQTRQVGHWWGSKDKVSYVLLWTLTYGRTSFGWPAWTYFHQLFSDTGCSLEDLLGAMDYWDW